MSTETKKLENKLAVPEGCEPLTCSNSLREQVRLLKDAGWHAHAKDFEAAITALRVIHTWATFDGGRCLEPAHVANLTRKALKGFICSNPSGMDEGLRSSAPSQVEGYRAAAIIINEHLDAAEARKPKTQRYVNRGAASFREGYYQGLLFAHCMEAYGKFPDANANIIKRALQRANAVALPTASEKHPNT